MQLPTLKCSSWSMQNFRKSILIVSSLLSLLLHYMLGNHFHKIIWSEFCLELNGTLGPSNNYEVKVTCPVNPAVSMDQ